jgi:hypothetical protein
MKWLLVVGLGMALCSLAQETQPKEPPSKPPQSVEDRLGRGLTVEVFLQGQPVKGIPISLWLRDANGRLQQATLKPSTLLTDVKGVATWSMGLGSGVWIVRLQTKEGLALSLPTTPDFLGIPFQIGPYQIKVLMFAP